MKIYEIEDKPVACIVKGNPDRMIGNEYIADKYYQSIQNYLEEKGFIVVFSDSEPYTCPPIEDIAIWIGHSRGCGRIVCLPENKQHLFARLGDLEGAINKDDTLWQRKMNKYYKSGKQPPESEQPPRDHFIFSKIHRSEVDRIIEEYKREI